MVTAEDQVASPSGEWIARIVQGGDDIPGVAAATSRKTSTRTFTSLVLPSWTWTIVGPKVVVQVAWPALTATAPQPEMLVPPSAKFTTPSLTLLLSLALWMVAVSVTELPGGLVKEGLLPDVSADVVAAALVAVMAQVGARRCSMAEFLVGRRRQTKLMVTSYRGWAPTRPSDRRLSISSTVSDAVQALVSNHSPTWGISSIPPSMCSSHSLLPEARSRSR